MNVKILKDFDYSLDGIKPTSFKKGDVVSDFNAKEVQKLTKSGRVGPEKASVPKQTSSSEEDKSKDTSEDNKSNDNSEDNKSSKQDPPPKPQANRDGNKSGNK